ncbi:phosphatase PAP2 family protein [Streptomyces sp. NRRL WC-3626]|uniref:phosphatase PAP2 family protein n=1 Tax=Streptomyces sp. NRRL WC-3626 TaxID=1463926 RepID=UPI0004BEBBBB|nr:phosphatase PAP2 family protein [Streptomyces sp. NRRL WC-3626]
MLDELTPPTRPGRTRSPVLPPPLRRRLAVIAGLAALVTGVFAVLYAGDGEPGGVDARVGTAVYGAGWQVAQVVDFLGDPGGAALLAVGGATVCLLMRWPRAAVFVVAGPGAAAGTTTLLKPLVGRTIHGDENLSYPSGHTAFLTAFAVTVALLVAGRLGLGRTAGPALVLGVALVAGAAMGWAQVAMGSHYPTDALGGWCTALAVVPATAWTIDAVGRKHL